MQKQCTNLSKWSPVHDFDSYLGHLSDNRYTVNVLNLIHDDSGLGHHDGAFLMVNLLHPVGFLHSSHLRVALDDLDPGFEFLRLHPYFYPRLNCMIRLARLHPSNPQHPYLHHVSLFAYNSTQILFSIFEKCRRVAHLDTFTRDTVYHCPRKWIEVTYFKAFVTSRYFPEIIYCHQGLSNWSLSSS